MIDWGGASSGPPEADVARTIVLLRLGEPDNPSPAIRMIARFARRLLITGYLRGYGNVTKIDESLLWRWVAVRAVDRLADPVEDPMAGTEALIAEARERAGG